MLPKKRGRYIKAPDNLRPVSPMWLGGTPVRPAGRKSRVEWLFARLVPGYEYARAIRGDEYGVVRLNVLR